MLNVPASSLASQLPQGFGFGSGSLAQHITPLGVSLLAMAVGQQRGCRLDWHYREQARSYRGMGLVKKSGMGTKHCGSWLASDGDGSGDTDVECAGLIAGKPAPTGILEWQWIFGSTHNPVGVSLLAMAVAQQRGCRLVWRYREQAHSYRGMGLVTKSGIDTKHCGSWLASDSGGSVTTHFECAGLIAGKPAPTGILVWQWIRGSTHNPCRSEPARDGGGSATRMSAGLAPSRASFAPAGYAGVVRSALTR